MSVRMNQWFVPGEGIAREVITADIQRYLGPDALVRPGTGTGDFSGQPGYWITAYRTLTTQMIADLKLDSQRWQAEKDRGEHGRGGVAAYESSRTHASRQHYGPSENYTQQAQASKQPYSTHPAYTTSEQQQHYVAAPPSYSTGQGGYTQHQAIPANLPAHQPRTDPYANYSTPNAGRGDYPGYSTQPYSYSAQPQQQTDQYGRPIQPGYSTQPPPRSTPAPGYYIASDGNQYPLSQQPQQAQPQSGQQRGTGKKY